MPALDIDGQVAFIELAEPVVVLADRGRCKDDCG
jgi:hypothetical protein